MRCPVRRFLRMLNAQSRLQDFPSLGDLAYLNTAAESIPPLAVHEALEAYWRDKTLGMRGRDGHFAAVEQCREVAARFLSLPTAEVSFCSCSSEAYNLLATALQLKSDDEVVVSDLDFPAGATPWLRAATPPQSRLWKARDGELHSADLSALLSPKTALVQVSLVSFYNGHRLDWQAFHQVVSQLAPQALIAVDITQALGRIPIDCPGADILISSTHKWTLGIHGGCVVGVPAARANRLTTRAGGWYHLSNAFDADRFERAASREGAASYSVGMPSFAALYALNASLRYLEGIGLSAIAAHADPLVQQLDEGLRALGLKPMCPRHAQRPSGIVAFRHAQSAMMHQALQEAGVEVMHHAGRIRLAVHGYNQPSCVQRALKALAGSL